MTAGYAPVVRCDRLSYLVPGGEPAWLAAIEATLTAAMRANGWRPGGRTQQGGQRLTMGAWEIDLNARLSALGAGLLPPEQWRSGCRAAGIDTIEIVLPPRDGSASAGGYLDPPDPLGERTAGNQGWWRNIPTRTFIAIVLALLIMLTALYLARQARTIAGADSGAPSSPEGSVNWADGKSELPGGYVSINYNPTGQDWEAVTLPSNASGANDLGAWFLLQRLPSGVVHYGVSTRYIRPPLSSQKLTNQWLAGADAARSGEVGTKVTHTKTRIDGRTAYSWVVYAGQGKWQRDVWVLDADRSFRFLCSGDAPSKADLAVLSKRCDEFVHSAKFTAKA